MIKTKTFLIRFLVSEVLPMLVLLFYLTNLLKDGKIFMFMAAFFILSLYISFINFILAVLLFNIKISRIWVLLTLIAFLFLIIYLYYNKLYLADNLASSLSKNSLIGRNIDELLIFMFLIINQLLVKLYYIIWPYPDPK